MEVICLTIGMSLLEALGAVRCRPVVKTMMFSAVADNQILAIEALLLQLPSAEKTVAHKLD